MPYSFMLAKEYTKDMKPPRNDEHCLPPIGWLVSEKYDGYRSIYNPEKGVTISTINYDDFSESEKRKLNKNKLRKKLIIWSGFLFNQNVFHSLLRMSVLVKSYR